MPPKKQPSNKRKASDQGNDSRDRQTRSQARAFNNLLQPSTSGTNNNNQTIQRPATRPGNQAVTQRGRTRARGRGRGVSRGSPALNRGNSVSLPRSASSTLQVQSQNQNQNEEDVLDVDSQYDANDDQRIELDGSNESEDQRSVNVQQLVVARQQQQTRRHDNASHGLEPGTSSTSGTSSRRSNASGNAVPYSAGPSASGQQQLSQQRVDQILQKSAGENVLNSFGRVVSGGINSLANNPVFNNQDFASSTSSNINNMAANNIHNNNNAIFNSQDSGIGSNNTYNNNDGLINNTSHGQIDMGNTSHFTMNSCPQPQALTSICSPLGECIPLNLKQKIIRGEFIDLGLLLDKGEAQAITMSGQIDSPILELNSSGQLVMRAAKSQQKITSIHSWTSAFLVYTAIYLSAHPARTQELLKYAQIIRTAAARFQGYGWRQYDVQFRLRKQIHPNTSWASMDGELWNLYIAVPSPSFSLSNSRGGHSFRGRGQSESESSPQFTNATAKTCFAFNKKVGCVRNFCKFNHICQRCNNGGHGASSCTTVAAFGYD